MTYLGVGDTQEGKLKQEVQQEANHALRVDAFAFGDVVLDVGKAGPGGREQDCHALSTGRRLHTARCQLVRLLGRAKRSDPTHPSQTMASTQRERTTK